MWKHIGPFAAWRQTGRGHRRVHFSALLSDTFGGGCSISRAVEGAEFSAPHARTRATAWTTRFATTRPRFTPVYGTLQRLTRRWLMRRLLSTSAHLQGEISAWTDRDAYPAMTYSTPRVPDALTILPSPSSRARFNMGVKLTGACPFDFFGLLIWRPVDVLAWAFAAYLYYAALYLRGWIMEHCWY